MSAADAEINDDLIPAGLELPGNPVLPRTSAPNAGGSPKSTSRC